MSTIRGYQADGTSVDDAIALVTAALGKIDEDVLLAQIRPVLDDGARAVAVIEMLAVLCAGFVEGMAAMTGTPPEQWLQRLALSDRAKRAGA